MKNYGWNDGYGPGASKIDTNRKFNIKIEYTGPDKFYGYTQTFTQDGNSIQFKGYSGYSQALTDDMNGHMAYAFSNWGPGGSEWLDGGRCQPACGGDSVWEISNLVFTTSGASPSPTPTPTPSGDYEFGDSCSTRSDGYCDGSCDCAWSWPKGSTWQDPSAACRCKTSSNDAVYRHVIQKLHNADINFADVEAIVNEGKAAFDRQTEMLN